MNDQKKIKLLYLNHILNKDLLLNKSGKKILKNNNDIKKVYDTKKLIDFLYNRSKYYIQCSYNDFEAFFKKNLTEIFSNEFFIAIYDFNEKNIIMDFENGLKYITADEMNFYILKYSTLQFLIVDYFKYIKENLYDICEKHNLFPVIINSDDNFIYSVKKKKFLTTDLSEVIFVNKKIFDYLYNQYYLNKNIDFKKNFYEFIIQEKFKAYLFNKAIFDLHFTDNEYRKIRKNMLNNDVVSFNIQELINKNIIEKSWVKEDSEFFYFKNIFEWKKLNKDISNIDTKQFKELINQHYSSEINKLIANNFNFSQFFLLIMKRHPIIKNNYEYYYLFYNKKFIIPEILFTIKN